VLDIALCFDARYAPYARVTIESLLAAEQAAVSPTPIRFWLVTGGDVNVEVRRTIESQIGDRAAVTFLEPRPHESGYGRSASPFVAHISDAMYLRLNLPALLPDDVHRLIYLDCDVLCTSSIAALADCDLAGKTVGAVRDAYTRRLADNPGVMPGLTGSTLDPKALYFNSGVLVIDVAAWRSAGVTERCLAYLLAQKETLRFPDQDALNFALYGDWFRLPKEWNYMMTWRLERVVAGRLRDARLIHSSGAVKYWHRQFPGHDLRKLYVHFHRAATDRLAPV
jgi:lipopolysaccharide biosynthesis glycosyltransferase